MDSQEVLLQQCALSQERVLLTCVCVCYTCCCLAGVSGNMLEWCLPKDMDLDGVEFKAIASGSHRVTTDFMWVCTPAAAWARALCARWATCRRMYGYIRLKKTSWFKILVFPEITFNIFPLDYYFSLWTLEHDTYCSVRSPQICSHPHFRAEIKTAT